MPRFDRSSALGRPAIAAALSFTLLACAVPSFAERRLDIDKLEKEYVAALDLLANGESEEALAALMEAEVGALGDTPSMSRIDRVWRHKLGIVRRALELTSHEVLVPVIVLHHDSYALYRSANKPIHARHARDMASDLAAYKVQASGDDSDRQFAGWVLASFGISMLEMRTASTSAGLLEDALQFAPDNPAALLGLAWAHETHGEYEEAIERLRVLLLSDPDHHHARLRLAACERRQGNLEAAEGELEELLENAETRWVRSIAYQELIRTHLSRSDLTAAASVAEMGLAEFPNEQEIALLLSSISERRGRSGRARQVVRTIEPTGAAASSARYIYDSGPDLQIERAREILHQMQVDRLDILASGLRWWGAGTGAPISTEGQP